MMWLKLISCHNERDKLYIIAYALLKLFQLNSSIRANPLTRLMLTLAPNSMDALAFPQRIGRTWGWLMLTIRSLESGKAEDKEVSRQEQGDKSLIVVVDEVQEMR